MNILLFLLPFALDVVATDLPHPLSDEFIELLNTKQNSWKAGRNYPEDTPLEHLTALFGTFLGGIPDGHPIKTHDADLIASLPETFDSREKWQNCPSLKEIRDQGSCGSCWAFGAVGAITDRWCIHSKGNQFHFSAQDVAGCSTSRDGCTGGMPIWAWNYWNTGGLVSGGNYNSNEGCKPYEIPECIHGTSDNANCSDENVIHCDKNCRDGYDVSYEKDKRFGLKPYHVKGEDHIKAELYQNGPLEVDFVACPDLFQYKSGVYRSIYTDDFDCGGHAVKLLGWGIENGTKYWLLANSWNTYWGDLGGFFKFVRGENHKGIESGVMGAMPKL